jgi:hypothetical protein
LFSDGYGNILDKYGAFLLNIIMENENKFSRKEEERIDNSGKKFGLWISVGI